MIIFLYILRDKGYFFDRADKLRATSCRAVLVKLDRRIPKNWSTKCVEDNLQVTVEMKAIEKPGSSLTDIKRLLYRELANNLTHVAINSPSDNLTRTPYVELLITHPKMDVNIRAPGQLAVKLATLKNKELIADLFSQFKVVEKVKK